jgi:phosphotransferase system HPr (HPr) family protein
MPPPRKNWKAARPTTDRFRSPHDSQGQAIRLPFLFLPVTLPLRSRLGKTSNPGSLPREFFFWRANSERTCGNRVEKKLKRFQRHPNMKLIRVTVPWPHGLHLRAASELVQLARRFRAQILLQGGSRIADTESVLSLLLLAAGTGTLLEVIACGGDEHEACLAVQSFFQQPTLDPG